MLQVRRRHAAAVHAHAVRAAEVPDPESGARELERRVLVGDRRIVEQHVGGRAASERHELLLDQELAAAERPSRKDDRDAMRREEASLAADLVQLELARPPILHGAASRFAPSSAGVHVA